MANFGMTTIMVDKSDLANLDGVIEALDEATYMGALTDEEAWPIMESTRKLRDRIQAALGA